MMTKEEDKELSDALNEIFDLKNEKFFCKKLADFYLEKLPNEEGVFIFNKKMMHATISRFLDDGISYQKIRDEEVI